jgi:benzoyl-CoA reductase/2-hydroxyglutaryl-CoA dehydratase subunit BcrC/BadD/HgdB
VPDGYLDKPRENALAHLHAARDAGKPIIGTYCCYAPTVLVWAMGAVPVCLCANSNVPVQAGESVLPANLCPMIKANYGFILTKTCPFFELAEAIVAETTCDGKKKMFELIRGRKPMHVLDLPQMPNEADAQAYWEGQVRTLGRFLEKTFDRKITDDALEEAIAMTNRRRRLILKIYSFSRHHPPVIHGSQVNDMLSFLSVGEEYDRQLEARIRELEALRREERFVVPKEAPRVMLTGCPISGDAAKVIQIVEEAGGVIVIHEACSGIKPIMDLVEEGTGDPMAAIARRYFKLPCSCMTPNSRRLQFLDLLIDEYRPQCVIDVILQACHTYAVESYTVAEHVKKKHDLPFLSVETDYSHGDVGRLRVRIETLLEMVK